MGKEMGKEMDIRSVRGVSDRAPIESNRTCKFVRFDRIFDKFARILDSIEFPWLKKELCLK